MNGHKEDECHNINVTDSGSPKIENIVEVIDPPPATQSQFGVLKSQQRGTSSGMQMKRPKLESSGDDYEPLDMSTSSHFLPEVLAQHDDCDVFGRSIAAQLRQMPRSQKIIAQRLISEVCFRGQIQALNITTTLGSQSTTVFQQLPQPVLPPYACKQVHLGNGRPPDYFTSHHPFANVRQQAYVSPVSLGSTAVAGSSYQGVQQQHPEHAGTMALSHNSISHSDVIP